ncbi:MAG: thermonuclease family protein [Leptolyngbyaceae bacterium]|nr:thermonuclease family protein [Leptolyngbyaceae bacterium]
MNSKRWWIQLLVGLWCGAIALGCQDHLPGSPLNRLTANAITGPTVTVMRVVSGQTIEVQFTNATSTNNEEVQLIGIQAPAAGQEPWNQAVKAYLEDLLLRETVQLEWDQDPDNDFGRKLAYVWLGDRLINQELLAAGYVLEVARSPNLKYDALFKESQHRARLLGLGIWNPEQPMRQTPNEFRDAHQS